MKIKAGFLLLLVVLFAYGTNTAFSYDEINTPQGKVVTGLSKEEALERFGEPVSAGDDLWLYETPEKFFVYFSGPEPVYLYPKSCTISVGIPLELKAVTYSSGFKIKDISNEIELLPSEPNNFIFTPKKYVIVPKKAGKYQILGKYGGALSNPVYLTVRKPQPEEEKEKLLAIDIIPYRPNTCPGNTITFMALGTFYDSGKNKYAVRDISELVEWFSGKGRDFEKAHGNKILFGTAGVFKVFCRYEDLESYSQDTDVRESLRESRALKHITLLPEFVIIPVGATIDFRAFGTYYDNRFEEINAASDWDIKDKGMLGMLWKGSFQAKSEGVTELVVESDKIVSLPAKVIIAKEQEGITAAYKPNKKKPGDLRLDFENLKKDILSQGKKLKSIEIKPEYLRIPLGGEGDFTARGIYDDNSETDLTRIGKWISSDERISKIILGKASALSSGECNIHMEFQGVRSAPASVFIEGPKLLSIIISPQNLKISMLDKIKLKAEGYFSDSSRKDITSLVSWDISGPRIIKIGPSGAILPFKFGHTNVLAKYLDIKSLPVDIAIVFTLEWLMYVIFKVVLFVILALLVAFCILYAVVLKEKQRLLSLCRDKPNEFIIELYQNLKKILAVFGLSQKCPLAPLSYAELVEKQLGIGNKLFLDFTGRFEEAKYSRHILCPENATSALGDYNSLIKILLSKFDKGTLFLKYCATLLNRKPLRFYNK